MYFYMTRRMRFPPEDVDTRDTTYIQMMILVNGADCASPGPIQFVEYINQRQTTYDEPLLITGLCSGLPAGPVDITVAVENYNQYYSQDVQLQLGGFVQPHLIVEEIYDDYIDM